MELLETVRSYLDITWQDPALDTKLEGILDRGRSYLDRIAGNPLDYSEGTRGRELLFEYVRYVRSNAFQDFARDFSLELNALHADGEVNRYDEDADLL